MAITLEKVKLYLRIDGDYEDELLKMILKTAKTYLVDAVTNYELLYELDSQFAEKADLLILVLCAEMYQNRDSRNDPRSDYSYAVRSMITQLQYWNKDIDNFRRPIAGKEFTPKLQSTTGDKPVTVNLNLTAITDEEISELFKNDNQRKHNRKYLY